MALPLFAARASWTVGMEQFDEPGVAGVLVLIVSNEKSYGQNLVATGGILIEQATARSDLQERSTGFPSLAKLVYSNFGGLEMPEQKPDDEVPEQKPDDLVAELVPDPAELPDLVVLRGYLGKSTRAGFSRLYVDLRFSVFVEVADEDVLAKRSLAASQDPLGGTVLWVKRSATLLRATVCLAQEHAAFLKGAITASALRRSRMELPVGRRLADFGVQRGGHTDPLFESTCRCDEPEPDLGCCLGPETTIM